MHAVLKTSPMRGLFFDSSQRFFHVLWREVWLAAIRSSDGSRGIVIGAWALGRRIWKEERKRERKKERKKFDNLTQNQKKELTTQESIMVEDITGCWNECRMNAAARVCWASCSSSSWGLLSELSNYWKWRRLDRLTISEENADLLVKSHSKPNLPPWGVAIKYTTMQQQIPTLTPAPF